MPPREPSRRTQLAIALAVVVVTAFAGACGGGDDGPDERYEQSMSKVAADVRRASAATASLPADADGAARSSAIEEQREAIDSAVERLDDLTAPSDVADPHDDLRSALADYSDLLGELAAAGDDPVAQGEVVGRMSETGVSKRIADASTAFERAGYDFEATS